MPHDVFHPQLNDYMVYHALLEITDCGRKQVPVSNLRLAKRCAIGVEEVEAAIARLEQRGYINGQWLEAKGAA